LGIIIFFFVFFGKWYINKKILIVSTIKNYLQIFTGFLIGFSPFLAFEARHGFINIRTIFGFIVSDSFQKTKQAHAPFLSIITDVFYRLFARLVFHSQYIENLITDPAGKIALGTVIVVIAIVSIVFMYFAKNKLAVILFYLWLFLGIFLFGFYKKSIYDYYFAFMFPLPFLIVGNFISELSDWNKRKIGILLSLVLFFAVLLFNLSDMPFRYPPNRQKDQVKTIAEFAISQTDNKPFNFALLTGGNSDYGYRYYFDVLGRPAVQIENPIKDPKRTSVTKQLIVVCEQLPCKPLGHPLFDIAGFGRAKIAGDWAVSVVKVYKLIPFNTH
jgi:hypothetical protein